MTGLRAVIGHGTENDFIVLPDLDGVLSLSASLVRALCDRHAGIGADGVLRVVRTALATEPDVQAQAGEAEYFMDYRNADGSIAEMCGNGVRVFARFLEREGLIAGAGVVATRGGPKAVRLDAHRVSVAMGPAVRRSESPMVDGRSGSQTFDLPNPHVVVELADTEQLDALDLTQPPLVEPPLAEGQNVEFFVRTGPGAVRMRVHERGVGETRSCGTGICAVAAAVGDGAGPVTVEVPGGVCVVGWSDDGSLTLTGPAELVADLAVAEDWLEAHR